MSGGLVSLVYASTASQPFRETALEELLATCRRLNAARDVTGMLLYRGGRFIQILEGARDTVDELFAKISRDPRHHDVRMLIEEPIAERRFVEWTMGYHAFRADPAGSPSGYRDSFADLESGVDREAARRALAELTLWFRVRSPRASDVAS